MTDSKTTLNTLALKKVISVNLNELSYNKLLKDINKMSNNERLPLVIYHNNTLKEIFKSDIKSVKQQLDKEFKALAEYKKLEKELLKHKGCKLSISTYDNYFMININKVED